MRVGMMYNLFIRSDIHMVVRDFTYYLNQSIRTTVGIYNIHLYVYDSIDFL